MRPWVIAVIAVTAAAGAAQGQGLLQIGNPTVESNQVVIPVYLGGTVGSGVAAMNFQVNYDPSVLRPVSASAGTAAQNADKRVMANETASGEYVVVMMGMNQTTFTSGEVARIVMERSSTADESQWKLGLSRPTLSGTDGTIIESAVAPFTPKTSSTDTQDQTTDGKSDTTDTPDTQDPSGTAQGPAVGTASAVNTAAQDAAAAAAALRNKRAHPSGRPGTEGQRALKQLQAALQARDDARGAIATPNSDTPDAADGPDGKTLEATKTVDEQASAPAKPAVNNSETPTRLASVQTVESTRSNPEGRATAAAGTVSGSPGAAWKAMAAGIAAGVAVAVLSLVVFRRKVIG